MNLAEKKQTLLHFVEDADEKLTGLLIALAKEYNHAGETYSDDELAGFYEVRDRMVSEPHTTYTPEDALGFIRNKNGDAV